MDEEEKTLFNPVVDDRKLHPSFQRIRSEAVGLLREVWWRKRGQLVTVFAGSRPRVRN